MMQSPNLEILLNLCAWIALVTTELRMFERPSPKGLDLAIRRIRRLPASGPDKFDFHSLPVLLTITLHAKLLLFP
jgi:hypothetical protein